MFYKIRIGFIGAGMIAHGHALALRSLIEGATLGNHRLELARVYDIDAGKAAVLAEQHGFQDVTGSPEEILNDSTIDTVYICTPTAHHKKYFLEAAASGKRIFVEKPLAFSTEDILEMIAARDKAGVAAQVGLVLRFEPVFWYLKNMIEKEKPQMGALLNFTFRSDQEWPVTGSFHDSEWRAEPGEAFAGCLFEHSIHDVDLIRYLFGEIGEISAFAGYHSDLTRQCIEDAVTVNLALASGSAGNLTSMYHRIRGRDVRRLEIFFERAAIILDDFRPGGFECRYRQFSVEMCGEKPRQIAQQEVDNAYYEHLGRPALIYPELVSAYRYQALGFIRSLLKGEKPFPGLETGLKAHHLIEAVYSFTKRKQSLSKIPV